MSADKWTPRGVDVKQLREEEVILAERLKLVRSFLDSLAEGESRGVRKRRRRANTRLDQIIRVLKEEGRPLPVQAIYRQLQTADPTLKWRNPGTAFRSYLRDQEQGPDEVVRTAKGIYGLSAWANTDESEEGTGEPTGTIHSVVPMQHPEITRK